MIETPIVREEKAPRKDTHTQRVLLGTHTQWVRLVLEPMDGEKIQDAKPKDELLYEDSWHVKAQALRKHKYSSQTTRRPNW